MHLFISVARYRGMNKFWAATYRFAEVSFARGCGLVAVEQTPGKPSGGQITPSRRQERVCQAVPENEQSNTVLKCGRKGLLEGVFYFYFFPLTSLKKKKKGQFCFGKNHTHKKTTTKKPTIFSYPLIAFSIMALQCQTLSHLLWQS